MDVPHPLPLLANADHELGLLPEVASRAGAFTNTTRSCPCGHVTVARSSPSGSSPRTRTSSSSSSTGSSVGSLGCTPSGIYSVRHARTPGGCLRPQDERHAHCPLCGEERADQLLRDLTSAEDALCPRPCAAAWRTLAALRRRESVNEVLASRRRLEYEAGQPFAPVFSELLLDRWRAGLDGYAPGSTCTSRGCGRRRRRWRREPSASTRLSRNRRTRRRRRSPFISPRDDRRQGIDKLLLRGSVFTKWANWAFRGYIVVSGAVRVVTIDEDNQEVVVNPPKASSSDSRPCSRKLRIRLKLTKRRVSKSIAKTSACYCSANLTRAST